MHVRQSDGGRLFKNTVFTFTSRTFFFPRRYESFAFCRFFFFCNTCSQLSSLIVEKERTTQSQTRYAIPSIGIINSYCRFFRGVIDSKLFVA